MGTAESISDDGLSIILPDASEEESAPGIKPNGWHKEDNELLSGGYKDDDYANEDAGSSDLGTGSREDASPNSADQLLQTADGILPAQPVIGDLQVSEENADSNPFGEWLTKNNQTLTTYFNRYDLDKSGTLNDGDELQYLTINVIKALDVRMSLSLIDETLEPALEKISSGEEWTFEVFVNWFYNSFVVQAAQLNL